MQDKEKEENTVKTKNQDTISDSNLSYAGFWIRVLAQIVDILLFLLFFYLLPLNYIFNKSPELLEATREVGIIILLTIILYPFISYFYQIFMISKFGGGIGKLISGIKVIYEDKNLLSIKQSAFRQIVGYFVSGLLFGLGFFWVLKDNKKQGWHDQLSGTFVIHSNKGKRYIGIFTLVALLTVSIILIKNLLSIINTNNSLKKDFSEMTEEYKNKLEIEKPVDKIEPTEELMII